jgi:hypothetical protein
MGRLVTPLIAWLSVFCTATQSNAQTAHAPPELGVGVSWLVPRYGDYVTDTMTEPTGGVRITLPFARNFAFESLVTLGRQGNDVRHRTEGLYVLQVKQRVYANELQSIQMFVTYGAAGYYAHVVQREIQRDGVVQTRGFSYSEVEQPLATMFGIGVQRRLGQRIAIRADAQLLTLLYLPLGYGVSTGVSIPLGRYSTN